MSDNNDWNVYLLLTSFSRSMLQVTSKEKIQRRSKTYSRDRENEVGKISIISLRLIGRAGKENVASNFKFRGPYSEMRPTKLTNHTARTN